MKETKFEKMARELLPKLDEAKKDIYQSRKKFLAHILEEAYIDGMRSQWDKEQSPSYEDPWIFMRSKYRCFIDVTTEKDAEEKFREYLKKQINR